MACCGSRRRKAWHVRESGAGTAESPPAQTTAYLVSFLIFGPIAGRNPRTMKRTLALALPLCVLFAWCQIWAGSAAAAESHPEGDQQFANLGDFELRGGGTIRDLRLGYRTMGQLNAEKSNAILWPTWLGGKTEDLIRYAGPGNVVDTKRYFVIFVDSLANGVTTSPSNSKLQPRLKYPEITIRDMVESEYKLTTDIFHLKHLHAVIGISMGGMQAFEWSVAHPDYMDEVVAMAGSPQSTSYDKLLWTTQIEALRLDPEWHEGEGTKPMTSGLLLYNEIGSMSLTSPAYRVAHTPPSDFQAFLETLKMEGSDARSACDSIRQRQAILSLDIPGEFGSTMEEAAKRVHAKMLIFVSPEDHTVNPAPALEFARFAGAPVITLDSSCGHQSTACISLGRVMSQFLTNPGSVSSQTMREGTGQ